MRSGELASPDESWEERRDRIIFVHMSLLLFLYLIIVIFTLGSMKYKMEFYYLQLEVSCTNL